MTGIKLKEYRKKAAGFSMIELMIAVFLAAMVASAAMGIYFTQNKQLIVEDEVTDLKANIKFAAVELTSKLRMAGYNVPDGVPKIKASNTDPDTITVTFDNGGFTDVKIEHPMSEQYGELRCDGHDISALRDGDWAFIYDPATKNGEFFLVTQVEKATGIIRHNTMPLSRLYPAGSQVIMLSQFKYYIDRSNPDRPDLICWTHRTGPRVFAENITDLNFQYILTSGQVVDVLPDNARIREIIVALDARMDIPDQNSNAGYKTGGLDTRVIVRNLGS